MSAPSSHATLKQAYINRVLAFRALYLANRETQDHTTTVPEAILLTCDLLDDYQNIGRIAEVFQDARGIDEFEWGIFGAFMNAVAIEHDQFDRILEQIHLEHTRANPYQILAVDNARIAMMTYYPSRSHVKSDQPKPTLWDADGRVRHNPLHFCTAFGAGVDDQVRKMFDANGPALFTMLSALNEMEKPVRERIVNSLLPSAFDASIPASDPRRLAIAPFGKREDQVDVITRRIITSLSYEPSSAPFENEASNFFATLEPWPPQERAMAWDGFVAYTLSTLKAGSSFVDNLDAADAFAAFLLKAADFGFDPTPLVTESSDGGEPLREVLRHALNGISLKDEFNPYPSLKSVICTAFLMITDDQVIINENLDRDSLLKLYVIKKSDVFRDALKTPEAAELLLSHELGL